MPVQKRTWIDDGQVIRTPLAADPLNSLEQDLWDALMQSAADPAMLFTGAVVRTPAGAPVSATITWPDGAPGVYSGTASLDFPGAVDAYTLTRAAEPFLTFTQPAVTRTPRGAVSNRPPITIS